MAEDQESPPSVIENLALVTDAIQTMFPDGKIICVYELNDQDFKKVQENYFSNFFLLDCYLFLVQAL